MLDQGNAPEVFATDIADGVEIIVKNAKGEEHSVILYDGQKGAPGNGITSINKVGTSGIVDTYRITFDNGSYTEYTVTNGKDGEGSVLSVNGKTGEVELTATDVGARPVSWTPDYNAVGADQKGTAAQEVSTHNTKTDAHQDIRIALQQLSDNVNSLFDSNDEDLNELQEIVDYIKDNRDLIDAVTINKVNVADIVDNLNSNVTNKPLSAAQGVVLNSMAMAQAQQLEKLLGWYDQEHYISMVASMSMSPSTTTYEIGTIVSSVTFNWTFTVNGKKAQLQSLKFNGTAITDLSQTTKTVSNIKTTSTYMIVGKRADGDEESAEAKTTISFYNRYYFGFAEDPRKTNANAFNEKTDFSNFIKNNIKYDTGWASSKPKLNKSGLTCPDGKYMWFAYPSRLGTSNFAINGFWGNFEPPIEKVFINAKGYEETYYLYRSTQDSLGTMDKLISE